MPGGALCWVRRVCPAVLSRPVNKHSCGAKALLSEMVGEHGGVPPGARSGERAWVAGVCSQLWGALLRQPKYLLIYLAVFQGTPRLRVELELQLPVYTAAAATWDPGRVCDLHPSSQQSQILNPWSEARDGTCILLDARRVQYR